MLDKSFLVHCVFSMALKRNHNYGNKTATIGGRLFISGVFTSFLLTYTINRLIEKPVESIRDRIKKHADEQNAAPDGYSVLLHTGK
jgi:hypothetical protein